MMRSMNKRNDPKEPFKLFACISEFKVYELFGLKGKLAYTILRALSKLNSNKTAQL